MRYCLLTGVRKRSANPRQPPHPLPPPSCAQEFMALSASGESALGDLDLNIIQMRMKWPRLFKDDAGNVDSQHWSVTDAVCFLHFCRLPGKYLHLRPLPPSSALRSRLDGPWKCERRHSGWTPGKTVDLRLRRLEHCNQFVPTGSAFLERGQHLEQRFSTRGS